MSTKIDADIAEDALKGVGWAGHKTPRARHRALLKAVRADGALAVFRRLNLLWIWNSEPDSSYPNGRRPKNPVGYNAHADRNFVRTRFRVDVDGARFES